MNVIISLLVAIMVNTNASGCYSALSTRIYTIIDISKSTYINAIIDTDNRMSWIIERVCEYFNDRDNDDYNGFISCHDYKDYKDFYCDTSLLYRRGIVGYYKEIGGCIHYDLYYNNDGDLVFAEVNQYRDTTYCIYFYKDKLLRISKGERYMAEEHFLDKKMRNAINVCLENAYE